MSGRSSYLRLNYRIKMPRFLVNKKSVGSVEKWTNNSYPQPTGLHSNYMLNRGYAYTTIISSKYHGQTLLSHLASLYPHSTPQAWQQNLNNGEVTLDGVTATGSESVISGQTLVWNRPPWIEPDAPQHFEVLFDDPICWPSTNLAGCPLSPAAASWKTPSCAWCKSKPPTQTLSTG